MSYEDRTLKVSAIRNGTVIDHIPADHVFKVVSLLNLEKINNQITIGHNLESKRMGSKGIIKISNKYFEQDEMDRIALIAPNVVLNTIKDFQVAEKKKVNLPKTIIDIVKCNNPKCITNNEPMPTRFEVIDKDRITLSCHYCDIKIDKENIILK